MIDLSWPTALRRPRSSPPDPVEDPVRVQLAADLKALRTAVRAIAYQHRTYATGSGPDRCATCMTVGVCELHTALIDALNGRTP